MVKVLHVFKDAMMASYAKGVVYGDVCGYGDGLTGIGYDSILVHHKPNTATESSWLENLKTKLMTHGEMKFRYA